MKKWKALLSCLAAMCAIGVFAACDNQPESTPGGSTPGGSTPDTGSSTPAPTTYTVRFVNDDGSLISEENYEAGDTVIAPADPTKAADETYTYTFAGWDEDVTPVEGDVTYTATYTATYINYTVKFLDENGDVLLEKSDYHYGDTVTAPADPTKAADNTYTYTFAGWGSEFSQTVAGNATYTATFSEEYINYTVKFLDENGDVLLEKTDYHYGDTVTAPANPTKAADETYTYTFAGWDNEVSQTVAGNATYTATFSEEYINYTVTFISNGKTISEKTDYHYGDTVTIPDDPEKAATEYFTFAFEGWDNEVSQTVAGNATYTAKFAATQKDGVKANKLSAGVGEGIVLGNGQIGDNAHYSGSNNIASPPVVGTVNQGYLAFDGNYSFNDYIAFDFTGKNMPTVAFFAKNYNESMYYQNGGKYGLVVTTGLTDYQGNLYTETNDSKDVYSGKGLLVCGPYMLNNTLNSGKNGVLGFDSTFCSKSNADVALGRANLEDGKQYRVVMGIESGNTDTSVKVVYSLYDLTTGQEVESYSAQTYNFFTDGFVKEGESRDQSLQGSIVLYGHFGTTTTIDKIHGVFEDTTLQNVANGLNSDKTYTVTFKDANGETLKTVEDVAFGETVSYDEALPTPEKTQDTLFNYSYAWDKALGKITADTVYTLRLISTPREGIQTSKVTTNGTNVVLGAGQIGNNAHYSGSNNIANPPVVGTVNQSYLAFDGNYSFNDYIAFDFTGKNMPTVAFFAKNYNESMYYQNGDKYGLVVTTGLTDYQGNLYTESNDSKDVYGGKGLLVCGPYMLNNTLNSGKNGVLGFDSTFCSKSNADVALGRANLEDGKQYRVVMGIESGNTDTSVKVVYSLYDLTTGQEVESYSAQTYNFFTDGFVKEGESRDQSLQGSIVLYGHFGTTTTIDKIHGVFENTTLQNVVNGLNSEPTP